MTVSYDRVWNTMNDLEMVTSKICSAREILDSAIDRFQEHQYDKVETLLYAVDEYLQYYLQEFDEKFKKAWEATVTDLRKSDKNFDTCDVNDETEHCKNSWNDFWEEEMDAMCDAAVSAYNKQNSKKSWVLPVNVDGLTGDCYVNFPDDLLKAANLEEGDVVEWIEQGDGSCLFKKVSNPK